MTVLQSDGSIKEERRADDPWKLQINRDITDLQTTTQFCVSEVKAVKEELQEMKPVVTEVRDILSGAKSFFKFCEALSKFGKIIFSIITLGGFTIVVYHWVVDYLSKMKL